MHWEICVAWKKIRMLRWEKCNPPEAFLPAEKGANIPNEKRLVVSKELWS